MLAKELGLNRETVATAYRELERLGLTEATVGRGTFVLGASPATRTGVGEAAERPFEPVFSHASESLRAAGVSRVDYAAAPNAVRFERLIPDASLYPHDAFRRALHRALGRPRHDARNFSTLGVATAAATALVPLLGLQPVGFVTVLLTVTAALRAE